MALKLDIRADVRDVDRALSGIKHGTATVVTRAANKAIRTARTAAVRGIARDVPGLKQKRVRAAMRISFANVHYWTSAVSATGLRIPIIDLGARQTQRGIMHRAQDGRRLIPSAFIATMESGHRGVFMRKGPKRAMKGGRYAGKQRQPIVELYGPSIPRVFIQERITAQIHEASGRVWLAECERQMQFLRRNIGLAQQGLAS